MFVSKYPHCTIKQLTGKEWLTPIQSLHKQVQEELSADKKHFLLPKDGGYFYNLLSGRGGVLLGVFVKNKLVGSTVLSLCNNFTEAKAEKRLTYDDKAGLVRKDCGNQSVGVIQSLCVLKDFYKQGLSSPLLETALTFAQQADVARVFAQVAVDNVPSWQQFLSNQFAILDVWKTDYNRYLLHHLSKQEHKAFFKQDHPFRMELGLHTTDMATTLPLVVKGQAEKGRKGCKWENSFRPRALCLAFA